MPEDLTDFLSCSITAGGFRLWDYKCAVKDIYKSGLGKVGEEIEFDCAGEITADDQASLTTAISDFLTATRLRGVDFSISVIGEEEIKLAAAACVEGGPYFDDVNIDTSDGQSRDVTFKVIGKTFLDAGGSGQIFDSHDYNVEQRPDVLQVIVWNGVLSGRLAQQKFADAVLPNFKKLYPANQWVVSSKYKADSSLQHASYTLTAVQLANALPAAGGATAVDGEGRYRRDRDQQGRLVETFEFDLLLGKNDNLQAMADNLRALVLGDSKSNSAPVILSESLSQSLYRDRRLQASYTVLSGGDGDIRLDWNQRFKFIDDNDAFDVKEFQGADPILVRKAKSLRILEQSGYTVGAGSYLAPPDPLHPDRMLDRGTDEIEQVDLVQMKTSWSYRMALPAEGDKKYDWIPPDATQRPATADILLAGDKKGKS